jgi:hypothetical protein
MQTPCTNDQPECKCQEANQRLKTFLKAEQVEIEKYKWCLGIQLCHDPLNDKSINDICIEWIIKYAAEFRNSWEKQYGKV